MPSPIPEHHTAIASCPNLQWRETFSSETPNCNPNPAPNLGGSTLSQSILHERRSDEVLSHGRIDLVPWDRYTGHETFLGGRYWQVATPDSVHSTCVELQLSHTRPRLRIGGVVGGSVPVATSDSIHTHISSASFLMPHHHIPIPPRPLIFRRVMLC